MSTRFYAAVAGSATIPTGVQKPYIPDHKVYFAAFSRPEPAYYLCALLNAPMVKEWIEAHNVSIQIGDVFKHMNLPKYDGKDLLHVQVAELAKQAHGAQSPAARAIIVGQIEPLTEEILLAWVARS